MLSEPANRDTRSAPLLFLLLMAFWLILSGRINIQSILTGAAASLLILWQCADLLFDNQNKLPCSPKSALTVLFLSVTLIKEIIKANIDIARIVLSPSLPIKPRLLKIPIKFKNDFNKMIYANLITLTPGTLTVEVADKYFVIHALTDEAAASLKDSPLEAWVLKLEEDNK